MTDRILALHRMDLGVAAQLQAQLQAQMAGRLAPGAAPAAAPILTVLDPVLHTHAVFNGFPQAQLAPLPFCDISTGVVPRAWAATRTLCAALDEVLAGLVPEAAGAAWCGHWLQHLHMATLGYRHMARLAAAPWAGDRLHVLLPDLPYAFGHHSFAPGLVLSDALRAAGVAVQLYASDLPPWHPPMLPDVLASDAAVDLLCHLPTCFYDAAGFSAEILASGRRTLVLPSQTYDVPTDGLPRCGLVAPAALALHLPADLLARIDDTLQRAAAVLVQHLVPLLPGAGCLHKQVQALLAGLRHNALVFFTLVQRFARQPPAVLLMSNHDAGLHGALYSFARRCQVRTLQVPHSKIFNVPLKSRGHDVLCLTHALQGGDVLDLHGDRMPTAVLDFGESLRFDAAPTRPLATLGIVLNTLSDMGMVVPDLPRYLDGLRRLRQWCAAQGVQCRLRCRPNGSAMALLCGALGITPADLVAHQDGPITDFGRGCDLVIGYDTPTSGLFELLDQGLPVMQALCRRLGPEEWSMVDAKVVPHLPVDQVLPRLAAFRDEPLALWQFRQDQLGQYARARSRAMPLRHWL